FNYHTPPRYRDSESHPLRIFAYVTHPVGWALREVVFRPWSAFVASSEVTKSVFGYREPFDFKEAECYGLRDIDCRTVLPYTGLVSGDDVDATREAGAMAGNGEQTFMFPDVA